MSDDGQFVRDEGAPWLEKPADEKLCGTLQRELSCHPVVARLLVQRGIATLADAREFLQPSLGGLSDPDTIPDIAEAVAQIETAIEAGEAICVYGDYDVDGITGTALLCEVLSHLGANVTSYIPHRLREGYGLNAEAIRKIADAGARLLITVDGGSNDHEELELAQSLGMQVIVTDHHLIHSGLPNCPVVHPGRSDAVDAFASLSGVAVAYKLIWALGRSRAGSRKVTDDYRELMIAALALVAMGTVADVVPLVGENRTLVHYGLRAFPKLERPGLRSLLEVCGVDAETVSAENVGFRLAPHINAAGRLGCAEDSLELLLTRDDQRGAELAQQLSTANRRRKEIELAMIEECETMLAEEPVPAPGEEGAPSALVFASESFHSGVAGIVAARLVDRYRRPVFVIALNDGEIGRGSIRSPDEIPLDPFYERARPHAESIGGHACAGGISVLPHVVEELRETLQATPLPPLPTQRQEVDAVLARRDVTMDLAKALRQLEPHGKGNPAPRFALTGLKLAGTARLVGKTEEHLSFSVTGEERGAPLKAIYFRGAEHATRLATTKEPFSMICEVMINTFQGVSRAEVRVLELCFSEHEAS